VIRRPLVSVVIGAYQAERFLGEALASLRTQTYQPLDVVVVDDGSTDGTAEIAELFDETRCIRLATNSGLSVARRAGIAAARGEFVTFLDADDVFLPDRVSAQVSYLLDHPETGCVLARHELLLDPGEAPPSWLRRDPVYGDLGGVEPGSAMLRTALAKEVQFDPTYRLGDGIEWLGRLVSAGAQVDVCERVLWRRRIHDANQTLDREGLRLDMLRMARARIREGRGSL
jgi:glycosyltransferase involved in cell wall biosynthesis